MQADPIQGKMPMKEPDCQRQQLLAGGWTQQSSKMCAAILHADVPEDTDVTKPAWLPRGGKISLLCLPKEADTLGSPSPLNTYYDWVSYCKLAHLPWKLWRKLQLYAGAFCIFRSAAHDCSGAPAAVGSWICMPNIPMLALDGSCLSGRRSAFRWATEPI